MKFDRVTVSLSAALFMSLVGNLFLGGIILGENVKDLPIQAEWMQKSAILRHQLSPKDEKILKASMRENQKRFNEMRRDLEDIRRDIKAATHAVPFDQETLDAALKEEKQKKLEILRLMQEARKEVMKKLSPEGVKALQKTAPPPRASVRRTIVPPQDADPVFLWEEDDSEH
jgi:uncharacterized membrane protein